MFPPIGSHSRPPSEDLRGTATNGTPEIHSSLRQHQSRRSQNTVDHQRRSPLRSNSLIPSTSTRYPSTAIAVATPITIQSPSTSTSLLVRSPSFVQNGSSASFEPAKSELDNPLTNTRNQQSSLLALLHKKHTLN